MEKMNILGMDYGSKVVGFAVYRDEFQMVLPSGKRLNNKHLLDEIAMIVKAEEIDLVVVGIPYMADGKETRMGNTIKKFAKNIEKFCKVVFQDETFSTLAAKEKINSLSNYGIKYDPKKIDEIAAAIILEDYLAGSISK